jgi:hypothetical protein
MDQLRHNNESTSFKLPEVQPDAKEANQVFETHAKNIDEANMSKAVEQNGLNNSMINATPQSASQPFISVQPIDNTGAQQVQPVKSIPVTDGLQASDTDLIEKAWVIKAKAIVQQTKNDPHEQTNEITKIKQDYQHKRFNTKIENE